MVIKNLSSIICTDKYGGIGKDGDIPWFHDKEVEIERRIDLAMFRYFTEDSFVICGRVTYDSLPKLPNRTLGVLTKSQANLGDFTFSTFSEIKDFIQKHPNQNFWCIGGLSLYTELVPLSNRLVISTLTKKQYTCDKYYHVFSNTIKFTQRKVLLNLPTINTVEFLR